MTVPLGPPEADDFVNQLGAFLDRARSAETPILFTSSVSAVGKEILPALGRQESEPLVHPDAFDKMRSTEVQQFISDHGAQSVIVTGVGANHAVMNTVIGIARHYHSLAVYVPLDGVHSYEFYTFEYAMYQLNSLPGSARRPLFTTLDLIDFITTS